MGWKDRYPDNAKGKTPLANYSIQVLVFDKLKPIRDIPAQTWETQIKGLQFHLTQPRLENMQKAVTCIALVWGVIDQMKRDNESLAEIVKAATAFVPSTGPAELGDLISMGAEIALDYIRNYKDALSTGMFKGSTLSQEQKAILGFMNPGGWKPDQTVSQWAAELLYIGEFAISSAQFGRNTADVHQVSVDALEEYMRIVRPLLYLYQRDRGSMKLSAVT
jgi:hypothetical protein